MGSDSNSGSSKTTISCFSKLLFRALAVVGFIWILLVGTGDTKSASFVAESAGNIKDSDVVGREKLVRPQLDINYMSKRRVPNGPDPIHNRRAGNSGRPPGQA
ncbi:CLAVATA3/ESR (CLE)-related protein 25 [Ziziphus jujuba]|uniref:CLAVATA3/ESR (CLE)-related protein 25 n=2 Tax=Ziziphus jujuba TaxID=326968 RepID=A0A6P4AZK1_ZIZJJ|nr:CLAVATA3/ESR (CLE)-related protein 25 [Ziziphus jujuba]KAH7515829.1 hypothetical protein FEM48_Zijuj10G0067800 [Ziziphus jujuba var. spinosa]